MADLSLDVREDLPGIELIPAAVKLLGGEAELHDKIAGQVFWFDFAALLPPELL